MARVEIEDMMINALTRFERLSCIYTQHLYTETALPLPPSSQSGSLSLLSLHEACSTSHDPPSIIHHPGLQQQQQQQQHSSLPTFFWQHQDDDDSDKEEAARARHPL